MPLQWSPSERRDRKTFKTNNGIVLEIYKNLSWKKYGYIQCKYGFPQKQYGSVHAIEHPLSQNTVSLVDIDSIEV